MSGYSAKIQWLNHGRLQKNTMAKSWPVTKNTMAESWHVTKNTMAEEHFKIFH